MDIMNKGYLNENFRLFHLRDQLAQVVDTHYHEFDKFVMVSSGSVVYVVEGISYHLLPGDILFVRHHDIHRPVISPSSPYERFVLWISPEYLEHFSSSNCDLSYCFSFCSKERKYHFRPNAEQVRRLSAYLLLLESSSIDGYGRELLIESSFVQLLVFLNRIVLTGDVQLPQNFDPVIDQVLEFINSHLSESLSIDSLAAKCFLSRYYFMRRFKEVTGYTVHFYIQQKRLALAAEKIDDGFSIIQAAQESGFSDYSSFLKAFRKVFGVTPGEYQRNTMKLNSYYSE